MNILRAIANFFKSLFGGEPTQTHVIDTNQTQTPKADVQPPVVPVKDTSTTIPQTQPQKEVPSTTSQIDIPNNQPHIETPPSSHDNQNYMVLKLVRYSSGKEDTLGKLYINEEFYGYTLEDQYHETKVPNDTRIPAGEYEILFRKVGGMNDTYSFKYKDIHKGMLWLQNVKGFEYVLIHIGNTEADTKGCILVGSQVMNENNMNQARQIIGSKAAYYKIYPVVAAHLENGGKVKIKIIE